MDFIELFYENPEKSFYLRQISKLTGTPKTTCARILKNLVNKKLILRKKSEPNDVYTANNSFLFRFYKKYSIIEKIIKSGLIDYIADKTLCRGIILFGSCSKGEYDKDSDIDLLVLAPEQPLDLKKFRLKHQINLLFSENIRDLSEELRNNVINGDKLYGYLKWSDAGSTSKA